MMAVRLESPLPHGGDATRHRGATASGGGGGAMSASGASVVRPPGRRRPAPFSKFTAATAAARCRGAFEGVVSSQSVGRRRRRLVRGSTAPVHSREARDGAGACAPPAMGGGFAIGVQELLELDECGEGAPPGCYPCWRA